MSDLSATRWIKRQLSRALRPVEARLRKRWLRLVDRCLLLSSIAPRGARAVIVRTDNIGDFVVWLHAARALTMHLRAQGMPVTLLANPVWSIWAHECGLFDEVIPVSEDRFRHDLRYRIGVGRQLRRKGFSVAIRAAHTRRLDGNDALVRLTGARERIGSEGVFEPQCDGDRAVSDRWYTRLTRSNPYTRSEMLQNAELVRAVTGQSYRASVGDLRTCFDLNLCADLKDELGAQPYFVLFPGATFHGRLWPVDRFAALADRVQRETGWTGVVCGGPAEAGQAERLCRETTPPLLNWVGRTTLTQLAAVLAAARLLVGNESSAVHIAAAVGTPAVCLLGGGHYGRFVPYEVEAADERPLPVPAVQPMPCFDCGWRCRYHPPKTRPVPCIEEISVELAWEAVCRTGVLGVSGLGEARQLLPLLPFETEQCLPEVTDLTAA